MQHMIGSPLIKFLPYFAKTQLSLPRGKKILSERKASKSRTTTDASILRFASQRQIANIILF